MLNAFGGVLSLFRHRRLGIRRVLEFAEMLRSGDLNVIYRWDMRNDTFSQIAEIARMSETISLYGGYTKEELEKSIEDKKKVLKWMVDRKVVNVDDSGFVVASYYRNPEKIVKFANEGAPYSKENIEKV
jgi:hypothetical protein